jgi:hypothetical protein
LLIGGVIGLVIGRLTRTKQLVEERPKEPSKLVIHWANYRAVENSGEVYEVDDFLRQIISGDSLVFDIETNNFDKKFVPHDPLPFKEKRLQVNYSYGSQPARTTERREHGRLLLPEDSKIQWLMGEVDRLKAAQPNPPQDPVPQLRAKIVAMVSELQGFLGEHGQEPEVKRQLTETANAFQERFRSIVPPWQAKFIGDYCLQFGESIPKLRDEMRARAHIDDLDLNNDIEFAARNRDRCCESVNKIAEKLWQLGLNVNV